VGLALKPPRGWRFVDDFSWNTHAALRLLALLGVIVAGPVVAD
jgi:hypothetical protein